MTSQLLSIVVSVFAAVAHLAVGLRRNTTTGGDQRSIDVDVVDDSETNAGGITDRWSVSALIEHNINAPYRRDSKEERGSRAGREELCRSETNPGPFRILRSRGRSCVAATSDKIEVAGGRHHVE